MITLSKEFNFSLGADVDQYYRHVRSFRNISNHPKPEPKPAAVAYMESRGISEEVTNFVGEPVYHSSKNSYHQRIQLTLSRLRYRKFTEKPLLQLRSV